ILVTHLVPIWIYTLSLHDALPILTIGACAGMLSAMKRRTVIALLVAPLVSVATLLPATADDAGTPPVQASAPSGAEVDAPVPEIDRKSTRLNSSHVSISYAAFCLK